MYLCRHTQVQPGTIGAKLVARAWVDENFKAMLLDDANAACAELGIAASNATTTTVLTVVENTPTVHNMVVCTLCSCYPLPILGLSPDWYKARCERYCNRFTAGNCKFGPYTETFIFGTN